MFHSIDSIYNTINNYLLTESEVLTRKSQTKTLPYWPSIGQYGQAKGREFLVHNDQKSKVNKLFIIWLFALVLQFGHNMREYVYHLQIQAL